MTAPRDYLNIVDIGHILKGSQKGVRVGEHPEFGGVSGAHSKNSHHYTPGGNALDVTDWSDEVIGGQTWKQRTAARAARARELGFTEALGPGDKGHDTHFHLALSDEDAKRRRFSREEIQWMATGQGPRPKRLGAGGGPQGSTTPVASGASGGDAPAPAASGVDAMPAHLQQMLLDSFKPSPLLQAQSQKLQQQPQIDAQSPFAGSTYTQAMQGAQGRPASSGSRPRPSLSELAGYAEFQPQDRGALNGLRGPKRPGASDAYAALAGLF